MNEKRDNFRIQYTLNDHPRLEVGEKKYPIIDLSSTGIKYYIKNDPPPTVEQIIDVVILFRDGTSVKTSGLVLRYDSKKKSVVLTLMEYIPMSIIMEQHRKLIQKRKNLALT